VIPVSSCSNVDILAKNISQKSSTRKLAKKGVESRATRQATKGKAEKKIGKNLIESSETPFAAFVTLSPHLRPIFPVFRTQFFQVCRLAAALHVVGAERHRQPLQALVCCTWRKFAIRCRG